MGLYDDVFAALAAAEVRYVVVGGVAVVLSGHVRSTVDLDVVIDLERDAALRAMGALAALGLLPRVPVTAADLADPDIRAAWVRDKNLQVLSFYDPAHRAREVDVFVTPPWDFEELVSDARSVPLGRHEVPVASVEHLIAMKRLAGRPQDLADIEALSRLAHPMTDPAVRDADWAGASFAGAAQAQAPRIRALSPQARMELLEELLELAEASGALERTRRDRQLAADAQWAGGTPT